MKIAIGTDDKKTIRKGHFGESRLYLVIEILNAQIVGKELRENPYLESGKAKKNHGQPEEIVSLLHDCSLFMARSMGKKSLTEISSRKIDCIFTNIDDIDRAVSLYLDGKLEGFKYYDPDEKDFILCSQRKYTPTLHKI
jgi:predicted Fe-Mo cluster-binding NifX family protein